MLRRQIAQPAGLFVTPGDKVVPEAHLSAMERVCLKADTEVYTCAMTTEQKTLHPAQLVPLAIQIMRIVS